MPKDRVIKPGTWWIVRFRLVKSYEQITGYMTCKNAHHAGHSGFERKYKIKTLKSGKRQRIYRRREWDLRGWDYRRFAYKFAELADLKSSVRGKTVQDWMKKHEGILEILQVEGCLYYNTVVSEAVLDRHFTELNEMEILALEHAMGE
jgi:hypothetical protein